MHARLISSVALAFGLLGSTAPRARADTDMAGSWTAGTTSMKVSIESWGTDCGQRPSSSKSSGGGTVTVTTSGHHLTIDSGGRQIKTAKCWSHNPSMKRVSSSYLDGLWTTVCKTPDNDPREEKGTYAIKALTPNKLLYKDVSRYNWKLKDSACIATITTTQTLNRQGVAAEPRQKAKAAAPPPPVEARCVAGPAARLALRPKKAVVQLGGQQCFRARVVDASGCPVGGNPVRLSLDHSEALTGTLEGKCFRASSNAAEGEGQFTLRASNGRFREQAIIEVKSMDLSALIAKNIEGMSDADEDAAPPAPVEPAPNEPAAKAKVAARTIEQSSGGGMGMAAAVIAVILLIGGGLFFLRKRGAPAAPAGDSGDSWPEPAPAPVPPAQAAPAAPQPAAPGASAPPTAGAEQWICPNCRRGYPAGSGTCTQCPAGSNALMPYSEFVSAGKQQDSSKRRCTDCGATWDNKVNFCGDCGGRNLIDS